MAGRLRRSPLPEKKNSSKVYYEMTDGLTQDGGGPGFLRQEKYGLYTQIRHQHGFTSGPAATKSFKDAGEYPEIVSPLIKLLARNNIGNFRAMATKTFSMDNNKTGVSDDLVKKTAPKTEYQTPNNREWRTGGINQWDGVRSTSYSAFKIMFETPRI